MSIPSFSEFPEIPQRSAPEADFDAKMYALFQHFALTHRAEMLAFIDFLENNSTVIGGALNGTTIGLNTAAAAKFTALEAESFGGAGVQASQTDTTAGKLLLVGAFGLGAAGGQPATNNDADQCVIPGFSYRFTTGGLNTPLGNPFGGCLSVYAGTGSGANLFQDFVSTSGIWRRYSTDGGTSWSAWRRQDPERGSNANGDYVRFEDGTQICTSPDWSLDMTTATGVLYRNASPQSWTFPASFLAPAGVVGGVSVTGNSQTHFGVMRTGSAIAADVTIFGPASQTGRSTRAFAIGRWK